MQPTNLSEYYSSQGKTLSSSVTGRFADPAFAAAATAAGYSPSTYAVNSGNATANNAILQQLLKSAAPKTNPAVQSGNLASSATTNAMNSLNAATNPVIPPTTDTTKTTTATDTTKPTVPSSITGEASSFQPQIDEINANAKKEIDSASAIFDSMSGTLDTNTQNLINSITESYGRRIADQTLSNSALLGATRVSGIVSGRDRYAQEIQQGILSAEETAGIKRLADLEAEKQSLISQAKNAADEKRMDILVRKMSELDSIKKNQNDSIAALYKNAMEFEKLAIDKSREARESIQADIKSQNDIAKSIAGALSGSIGDGSSEEDQQLIQQAAKDYGVDPNFITTALNEYRSQQQKDLPSMYQEYDEYRRRGGSGSLQSFLKMKSQATHIGNGTGSDASKVLTSDEQKQLHLPPSLVGKSDYEVIQSLSFSTPPDWFGEWVQQSEGKTLDAGGLASVWEQFRNSPEMMVYKNTIDLNKAYSGKLQTGDSQDITFN